MKKLGVIGGLGPIATAYFIERVVQMTDAGCDQDHLQMIIYHWPSIPDRTGYIMQKQKENPLIPMIKIGKRLMEQGADYIAIPCITAHYFYKDIVQHLQVPMIHIIHETVQQLVSYGVEKVGLMATDGTIKSMIFQKELEQAGILVLLPTEQEQHEVMELIYKDIKANHSIPIEKFQRVSHKLRQRGAGVIVLGCTELSLIKRDYNIGPGYLDALDVLAKQSVIYCGAPLKKKYEYLITV